MGKVIHGDCLEVMPTIPGKSIDMILCDLPYGTTACKWDTIIPFEPLWKQYKRLIKDNGAIVLTASQPFTTALIVSNPDWFKYEWIWCKNFATGSLLAKKRPMKGHENILVFYGKQPTYNPQMVKRTDAEIKRLSKKSVKTKGTEFQQAGGISGNRKDGIEKMPNSKLWFDAVFNRSGERTGHPTQKPVALLEYLIKTYTNKGETVLDNCAGSGTTAIACINTNRNYILIEKEQEYIGIINKRISEHEKQLAII